MHTRRWIVPGLLTGSLAGLVLAQVAVAESQEVPELDCSGENVVVGDVLYGGDAPADSDSPVEATEQILDGPALDGSSASAEVEATAVGADEAVTTVTQAGGEVSAIATLEGSDTDGWRVTGWKECA